MRGHIRGDTRREFAPRCERRGRDLPRRYCIPFSFDETHSSRSRHDQLSVIFRVLETPTPDELSWADSDAAEEVSAVCGGLSDLGVADRDAQRRKQLRSACPVAGKTELDLLSAFLDVDPNQRPSAAAALEMGYFDALPDGRRPPVTEPKAQSEVDAAFAFEQESASLHSTRHPPPTTSLRNAGARWS